MTCNIQYKAISDRLWSRCSIMRGGMEQYLTPMGPTKLHVNPIFEISPLEPHFAEWLVFEGLSVDEHGRQHFLDASVAFKRAVLNCIHYLSKFGSTKEQASQKTALLCTASMQCCTHQFCEQDCVP